MNYLGHLYLSGSDTSLMVANLYGDFYKGRIHEGLDPVIKRGIQLHREIDSFMDHHSAVSDLAHSLSNELPKVSPIAIDIYFDHLLALYWKNYHVERYDLFLEKFYSELRTISGFSPSFSEFSSRLEHYRWLNHYPHEDSIDKMCRGVNSRLSFESALIDGAKVFKSHKSRIMDAFLEYMPDAIEHFGIVETGQMR